MNWITMLSGTDWEHAIGFSAASIAVVSLVAVCFAALLRGRAAAKDGLLLSALVTCFVVPLVGLSTAVFQSSLVALPIAVRSQQATDQPRGLQRSAEVSSHGFSDPEMLNDVSNINRLTSPPKPSTPIEKPSAAEVSGSRMGDSPNRFQTIQCVAAAWLLGTMFFMASGWRSHRRGWAIRHRAIRLGSEVLERNASNAAQQVGLRGIPTILESDDLCTPAVHGIFAPVVVFPTGLIDRLSGAQLYDVLVHEFAHIRRRDTVVVLGEMMARALFWPILTVPLMLRALARTREDVCDNYVLQFRNSVDYAETLLKLAQLAQGRRLTVASVGILNWRGALEKRIEGILSDRRSRSKSLPKGIFVPLLTLVVLIGVVMAGSRLIAIEQPEKPVDTPKTTESTAFDSEKPLAKKEGNSEKANAKIGVVDWKGKPVVNAQVELWQLAYSSSGFGGGSRAPGTDNAFSGRTDEKGEILVPYPKVVAPNDMPVTRLGLKIVTPDNPTWSEYRSIEETKPIVLSRPVTVSVSAKLGPNGKVVTSNLYAITNKASTNWKLENARLVSGPTDVKDGQLRVVHTSDDEPAWFSTLIDFSAYGIEDNRILIDTVLEPSVTLRGKLGDEMARPIRNGRIIARASSRKTADRDRTTAIGCVVPVSREGEFVLANLPAETHVQLIAFCDGGISRSPTPSEVRAYSERHGYPVARYFGGDVKVVAPQLYFAYADASSPIVPMDPTGDVEVTAEDWNGNPISGATVDFSPNQNWLDGGSQALGIGIDTLKRLRMGIVDRFFVSREGLEAPANFQAITDADGKAVVRNLPAGVGIREYKGEERRNSPYQGFRVTHENYTLIPKEPQRILSSGRPQESVDMTPSGLAKIRVRMERRDNRLSVETVSPPVQASGKQDTRATPSIANQVGSNTTEAKKAKAPAIQTKPINVSGTATNLEGVPVAGAKVHLISTNGITKQIATTTTDATGRYSFENADMPTKGKGGTIQVFGMGEGYGLTWHGMRFVVFEPRPSNQPKDSEDHTFFDDEPIEMNLQFPPAAKLYGRILNEKEQPVVQAQIEIGHLDYLDTNGRTIHPNFRELSELRFVPEKLRKAITNDDGYFEITGMPLDSVAWVGVTHKDYADQSFYAAITNRDLKEYTFSSNASTTIRDGKQVTSPVLETRHVATSPLAIRVAGRETVSVRLVDAKGQPLSTFDVSATSGDESTGIFATGKSDMDGKVTLRLPPGEYRLSVRPPKNSDFVSTEDILLVKPGSSKDEELKVIVPALGCVLVLRAVDADSGLPLKGVSFWKEVEGRPGTRTGMTSTPDFVDHPTTDAEGELITTVKPGKRVFGVGWSNMPAGYHGGSGGRTIECKSGETLRVTFELRREK